MPKKRQPSKNAKKIEPYQSTAEVTLKMLIESDKWLINNFQTSVYAWTIFTIANTIFTSFIWYLLGFSHFISIILIFTVGLVWGMYVFVLYQTKIKIDTVKAQIAALRKREEDFLKRI
jgi:preprotein translocase subunit SecF